jgi:hypothetical protein
VGRSGLLKNFKELAMRRYMLLMTGLLMVGAGGYLIFANPPSFPLWFVWLVGPGLWYVGIGVTIGGVGFAAFMPRTEKKAEQAPVKAAKKEATETRVLHLRKYGLGSMPAGVIREVPAMGGFIM